MGEFSIKTYDEVYAREELYWGTEPNNLCKEVTRLYLSNHSVANGDKVVDLGCGEGKDIIHFAKHGFHALGVDISAPGLAKAENWAKKENVTIQTVQASLIDFRLTDIYDVIYSSGTLTYLPADRRKATFDHYKDMTRVGGIHAFNVFVEKPFIATAPDWGADEYFYRSGELLAYYWDWEILSSYEVIFDCNSSGIPHRHAMDVMIAIKR